MNKTAKLRRDARRTIADTDRLAFHKRIYDYQVRFKLKIFLRKLKVLKPNHNKAANV